MAASDDIRRIRKVLGLCAATLFAAAVFLALPLSNTALAYYTLDPVKITLGSSSLSLDVGATTTVSITCDMWSEEQLPGCGDAACPESCGSMVTPDGVVGGCLNEDGWCTCGGTTPVTEYTVLSVSSSNTSVVTAAISGRSLTVSGRAAGVATLTVTATLAKHIDATERLTVAVFDESTGSSSTGSNSSSGSSGGTAGSTTSNGGGSSASSSAGGSVAKSRGGGSGGSVSASSARRPSVQVSAAGGNGGAGSGAKGSKQQAAAAEQASANFEDADGLGGVGAALAGNGATQGAGGLSTLVARSGTPYLITIAIVVVVLAAAFFILYFYRRRRRRREAASYQASAEALFGAAEEAPQETATASGKN